LEKTPTEGSAERNHITDPEVTVTRNGIGMPSVIVSSVQRRCLTRMTEINAPAPRPTDRKNDIAAPAISLFSQLTRLSHTNTYSARCNTDKHVHRSEDTAWACSVCSNNYRHEVVFPRTAKCPQKGIHLVFLDGSDLAWSVITVRVPLGVPNVPLTLTLTGNRKNITQVSNSHRVDFD